MTLALRSLMLVCVLLVHPLSRADVVADWNRLALDMVTRSDEPLEGKLRAITMVHVAMFEAVNFVQGRYAPHFIVRSLMIADTPVEVVAAAAAHHILADLYPTQASSLDAALRSSLRAHPARQNAAIVTGKSIAAVIGGLRALEPWPVEGIGGNPTASPVSPKGLLLTRTGGDATAGRIRFGAARADELPSVDHQRSVGSPLTWNSIIAELIAIRGLNSIEAARIHALTSMAITNAYLVTRDARDPCKPCIAAAAVATILESEVSARGRESEAVNIHQVVGRDIGRYMLRHYYQPLAQPRAQAE